MKIKSNTLSLIRDRDEFQKLFLEHVRSITRDSLLVPRISKPRLFDAHYAWQDDLARVESREKNLNDGLDHFKQCGHLAYWLRRMAPVVEYDDYAEKLKDGEDDLYESELRTRKLFYDYGTEYIAFDFGFRICTYYEQERLDRKTPFIKPTITERYLQDVCHMLKFKHVSPHSTFLIYRSLLLN